MRLCERNGKIIYYATYTGKTEIIDANGNRTGRYTADYTAPLPLKVNVSAARGTVEVEQFGAALDYSKVLVSGDADCPITETSVLWIDTLPELTEDNETSTPYDYKVVAVARSLNYASYAIKKVVVG